MYVQQIELLNFKTIKEFSQEFNGGIYIIKGENEVGKTTLIGAIVTLLTGDRSDNLLTTGAEKGYAKMTVGDDKQAYEIELKFTDKNPRGVLTISQKGSQFKSDRLTVLQEILKYQDLDANEFVRWSESAEGRRRQIKLVKSLLPVDVQKQIEDIEMTVSTFKNEITTLNSEIKVYDNFIKHSNISDAECLKYDKPIDARELIDTKTRAAQKNEQFKNVQKEIETLNTSLDSTDNRASEITGKYKVKFEEIDSDEQRLKAEFDASMRRLSERRKQLVIDHDSELTILEDNRKESISKASDLSIWVEKNPEIPLDKIQVEIDESTKHNEMHVKVQEHVKNKTLLTTKVNEKKDKDDLITKLEAEKEQLILSSSLPVEGLSFDDDGLTLNKIPFKVGEISTSQEMEVAAKLIIAKNPNVKVFKIAQGESLGVKRMKAIVDFAKANGYQGFIENVVRGLDELKVEEYTEV
jgi:hypothetical protein